MTDTLRRLHRLRKLRAEEERRHLAAQERARDAQAEALEQTTAAFHTSHASTDSGSAEDLARHQAHALRLEMRRRQQTVQLTEHERRVAWRRQQVQTANRAKRTAERTLELREEAEAHLRRGQEQRELDEVGLQGWWGRQ